MQFERYQKHDLVLESDMQNAHHPSKSRQILLLSQKLRNVVKRMQNRFSDFLMTSFDKILV